LGEDIRREAMAKNALAQTTSKTRRVIVSEIGWRAVGQARDARRLDAGGRCGEEGGAADERPPGDLLRIIAGYGCDRGASASSR